MGDSRLIDAEVRISLRPVMVALVSLGALLVFLSSLPSEPALRFQVALLAGLAYALAALVWLVSNWAAELARWLAVAALAGLIHLAILWLPLPGLAGLLVLPALLAVPVANLPAAVALAALETMLLLACPWLLGQGTSALAAIAPLTAIWAVVGIMAGFSQLVHRVVGWSWQYSRHAQTLLEESRDHKAALEQALDDLAHANRQLALASERTSALRLVAEEAQRTKSEFAARVSHEFRTPLNMIIGLVELMVERPQVYPGDLPAGLREDLRIVYRNCEHLSSMINDVLDLSRIEAGRLTLHREPTDPREIIESALAVIRPLAEKKQLALSVALPSDLPPLVCDRTRIRQVILNVLSNAARYTFQGSISVRALVEGPHITIAIADTGPGISPEDAHRIFEPFWQSSDSSSHDRGGSGLGLSISKHFVALHGGRIWLESGVGVGTTCFVVLPLSEPADHVAPPWGTIREDWVWKEPGFKGARAASTPELTRPRIVVYDESQSLGAELANLPDVAEFVPVASTGEALSEATATPAHGLWFNARPERLLTLAETARHAVPGTPVFGSSVPRRADPAVERGARGQIVKPVTQTVLQSALRAVGEPLRQVLLVDDDPEFTQLLARMLWAYNSSLEVTIAHDGRQALEMLRGARPDLVFLDLVMPGMDGWGVLGAMRRDAALRQVPVYVLSARDPQVEIPASPLLLAATAGAIPVGRLVRCLLSLSATLSTPD